MIYNAHLKKGKVNKMKRFFNNLIQKIERPSPNIIDLVKNDKFELVEPLINNIDYNLNYKYPEHENMTALSYLICIRQYTLAIKILETGRCDINIQNDNGMTALMHAVYDDYGENDELIKKLINDPCCDFNLKSRHGFTALMILMMQNHSSDKCENIIKQIISSGRCNLDILSHGKHFKGYNVLMIVLQNNLYPSIANLLIESKCDINIISEDESTAFSIAVLTNNVDMVKKLINNKCNIYLKNCLGQSVLELAVDRLSVTMKKRNKMCDDDLIKFSYNYTINCAIKIVRMIINKYITDGNEKLLDRMTINISDDSKCIVTDFLLTNKIINRLHIDTENPVGTIVDYV
ncbi:MAG: hypothetical protein Edafosvirus19_11 [Edafosvirus sp.]|uniref:Uncharacterized protein n=1 Tax=Edafosvirus sp. TaxID=2487765 RepID=A0A3G4ZW55_9VIRU|nr:MAG: hypothetical protein Edafosvirus19_11 [Edafosvirus sp.]